MTIGQFIDAFMPRFVTDKVAFELIDGCYCGIGPLWLLEPGERYDATGTFRSFNLFGWAMFPKLIGEIDKTPGFIK